MACLMSTPRAMVSSGTMIKPAANAGERAKQARANGRDEGKHL